MAACKVTGAGPGATLACSQPIVIASSTFCRSLKLGNRIVMFCNFLDKPFLSIDPVRHRLYATFTEFPQFGVGTSIELSACDLGSAAGGRGPAGGTPAAPVCEDNAAGKHGYLIVVPASATGCENEGAYPAVDPVTGDVYIGYESNWFTSWHKSPPVTPCPPLMW